MQKHPQAGPWDAVNVIVTLQDRVRLTDCDIKSVLSQLIFISDLSSRERRYRLWLLKEMKTAFVLLIESMVFSEQNVDQKQILLSLLAEIENNSQLSQKGTRLHVKTHEPASKNKIGSTFRCCNLHSRKVSYRSVSHCFMGLGDVNDFG